MPVSWANATRRETSMLRLLAFLSRSSALGFLEIAALQPSIFKVSSQLLADNQGPTIRERWPNQVHCLYRRPPQCRTQTKHQVRVLVKPRLAPARPNLAMKLWSQDIWREHTL